MTGAEPKGPKPRETERTPGRGAVCAVPGTAVRKKARAV